MDAHRATSVTQLNYPSSAQPQGRIEVGTTPSRSEEGFAHESSTGDEIEEILAEGNGSNEPSNRQSSAKLGLLKHQIASPNLREKQ
jgi:hypothetical protein